jgi:hypothetical protein
LKLDSFSIKDFVERHSSGLTSRKSCHERQLIHQDSATANGFD